MTSPLSQAELAELEATLLPALERHHLRLLAHGLRTLQAIAGRREGEAPAPEVIEAWALQQPAIAADPHFLRAFTAQLHSTGEQLRAIAAAEPCSPLALELPQLIRWAQAQADARVR